MSVVILWNDEWILDNWQKYRNWNALQTAYNAEYGTFIKYNTFKSHCYRLGLDFHYTQAQDMWLIENYPRLGRVETTKQFNIIFSDTRSVNGIKKHCLELGLHVSEERKKQRAIENTERFHKKGSIVFKNGYYEIKRPTDGKWQRLHRYVWEQANGKIPKGHKVIFLDNDNKNCDLSNLICVPPSYLALMTRYGLKSEHKEITKTAVKWCELKEAIE